MGTAKLLLNSLGNGKTVKAWLVVNDNTSASGFYKKLGFKKVSPYLSRYLSIDMSNILHMSNQYTILVQYTVHVRSCNNAYYLIHRSKKRT